MVKMIVEVVRQAEQTLVGLTVRRRLPVHHGDWVSRCWRRRYLSWSWRGSPTAASATFSCSAPLQHLLAGLQGLLLPHPRGQLIHQPPCGVRVMVSWRSRPDWAADRDGWYPLQSVVSDDQTKKRKKRLWPCLGSALWTLSNVQHLSAAWSSLPRWGRAPHRPWRKF